MISVEHLKHDQMLLRHTRWQLVRRQTDVTKVRNGTGRIAKELLMLLLLGCWDARRRQLVRWAAVCYATVALLTVRRRLEPEDSSKFNIIFYIFFAIACQFRIFNFHF